MQAMKQRSTLWAILGAGVLTLGVATTAFAITLTQDQEAIVAGWDDDGDPFAVDALGDPFPFNQPECAGFGVQDGEIVFHFVQSGDVQDPTTPNGGGTTANTLDVDLNDGEIFLADLEAETVETASVDWLVAIDPPGDELELVSATSNVDGGELVLAHLCIGDQAGAEASGPDTATIDRPSVAGNPADGAWLLVAALGVVFALMAVLMPARPKALRR
jgi:hypothetical protein